jgi:hypothetical protein
VVCGAFVVAGSGLARFQKGTVREFEISGFPGGVNGENGLFSLMILSSSACTLRMVWIYLRIG